MRLWLLWSQRSRHPQSASIWVGKTCVLGLCREGNDMMQSTHTVTVTNVITDDVVSITVGDAVGDAMDRIPRGILS